MLLIQSSTILITQSNIFIQVDSGASEEQKTLITTAHINFTSTQTDAKHTNTENGETLIDEGNLI